MGELRFWRRPIKYSCGCCVDSSGNVYVADTYNHRVQKFSSSGVYQTQWGTRGSGDGQFIDPSGVAVDSSGNVYVADYGNNRVQKFAAVSTDFTISVFQGANGVISPGTLTVISGSDQSFSVTPNSGYYIASITSDAGAVTVTSPYGQTVSFNNVQAAHTITATYAQSTSTAHENIVVQAMSFDSARKIVTMYTQSTGGLTPVVNSIIIKDASGSTIATVGIGTISPTATGNALTTGNYTQ